MSGLRFFEFGFRRSRCPPNRRVRTHTATLRLRVLIWAEFYGKQGQDARCYAIGPAVRRQRRRFHPLISISYISVLPCYGLPPFSRRPAAPQLRRMSPV